MHVQRTLPTAWAVGLAILLTPIGVRSAEVDARQLAEGFKAADMRVNDGKGQSESADSGTLGWGESKHLEGYIALWEVTQDRYWLTKITEHFQRIMGNASDPDGDGYLSWQTGSYSCAVAYAERNGLAYTIVEPTLRRPIRKSYADNFRFGRKQSWTH